MSIVNKIKQSVTESLSALYNHPFTEKDFQVNQTKPEFEGDYTIVMFSLVKALKLSPEVIGDALGNYLVSNYPQLFSSFNIIKGFLNLSVTELYWIELLKNNYQDICYGKKPLKGQKIMVEYSSPNTNKPLHLGHLRNNFLGWSVSEILKANGFEVIKSAVVNDRGIHICKSMLAWQKFGNGETPQSSGMKGDHLVGKYYVLFDKTFKAQYKELTENFKNLKVRIETKYNSNSAEYITMQIGGLIGMIDTALSEERGNIISLNSIITSLEKIKPKLSSEISLNIEEIIEKIKNSLIYEVSQMLLDWEEGKPEVIELWKKMNQWVYDGFSVTYKRIGSDFDITYYESNTYLLGKDIVQDGLNKNVFFKKEDGSIWIDLTADGLDEKLVQRKDGTSVYITQDIGLAQQKYEQFKIDQSIYVIGNEQNYHMKVLQLICKKLGMPNAEGIYHLSYGMVELTTGKMKSREGTVVDADDLVDEMISKSEEETKNHGKSDGFTEEELQDLYNVLGLGALKFYLLRVDPKKTMVFDPKESVDIHGFTGPFIQYSHARIKSILRKINNESADNETAVTVEENEGLLQLEKELLFSLEQYPIIIEQAAVEHNPSVIANFIFHLAKTFNSFYAEHSVANAETASKKQLRVQMSTMTANVIKSGMQLLGINVPERM